jgi:hypothetical protein
MRDREQQVTALKTLAHCIRSYSPWFAAFERGRLDPSEVDCRRLHIDSLAANLDHLAELVPKGAISYGQVDAIMTELHNAGFYPDKLAVDTVVLAFAQGE